MIFNDRINVRLFEAYFILQISHSSFTSLLMQTRISMAIVLTLVPFGLHVLKPYCL